MDKNRRRKPEDRVHLIPLTPPIEPGESLPGYLFRLTRVNDYNHSSVIARSAGLDHMGLPVSDEMLDRISMVTSKPKDMLRAANIETLGDRKIRVRAHVLSTRSVSRRTSRICPACLAGSEVHRLLWSINAVEVCPIHGCRLINKCPHPGCGKILSWDRKFLGECGRGHPLGVIAGDPTEVPVSAILLARAIAEKFGERTLWDPVEPTLPQMVRDMTLKQFQELLITLHSFSMEKRGADNPRRAGGLATEELSPSFTLLMDWPRLFHEKCTEFRSIEKRNGRQAVFPKWRVKRMHARANEKPVLDFLDDAISGFVALNDLGRHVHGRWVRDSDQTLSLNVAAQMVGVAARTLFERARNEGFELISSGGEQVRLLHKDVDELRKLYEQELYISSAEVATRIGLHSDDTRQLIRLGAFGELAANRRRNAVSAKWKVEVEEFNRFEAAVKGAIRGLEPKSVRLRAVGGFRRASGIKQIRVADVIMAVLRGELVPYFGDVRHMGKLRYSHDDLLHFCRRRYLDRFAVVDNDDNATAA